MRGEAREGQGREGERKERLREHVSGERRLGKHFFKLEVWSIIFQELCGYLGKLLHIWVDQNRH